MKKRRMVKISITGTFSTFYLCDENYIIIDSTPRDKNGKQISKSKGTWNEYRIKVLGLYARKPMRKH